MKAILTKLKHKIRDYIKDFLQIDELTSKLESYKNDANRSIKDIETELSSHKSTLNRHKKMQNEALVQIDALHNTVSSVVSMGSDIAPYGGGNSWAVVCIEGQYNVVKFFDLSHRDGREMLRVLKAFEGGRYVNDTPHDYFPKEYFADWLK